MTVTCDVCGADATWVHAYDCRFGCGVRERRVCDGHNTAGLPVVCPCGLRMRRVTCRAVTR